CESAGSRSAINSAMIEITTNNSMSVKPRRNIMATSTFEGFDCRTRRSSALDEATASLFRLSQVRSVPTTACQQGRRATAHQQHARRLGNGKGKCAEIERGVVNQRVIRRVV